MAKDFFDMTPAERDAEAKIWEKGIDFADTRPMSKRSKALWALAKRGRPSKPASEKAKRVLITVDSRLYGLIDTYAKSHGLSRSQLFAKSVQAYMRTAPPSPAAPARRALKA